MKLPPFYLCLLAIMFHAISASTTSRGKIGALSTSKKSGPNTKPVVGLLARKGDGVVGKEDRPKLLIEMLPKTLVEIVIGYFNDGAYSILVFTLTWSLAGIPRIAVDSARVYVMTDSQGLKGLSHSLANAKEDARCIELGNPQWSKYYQLGSSHDGRYVSFSHFDKTAVHLGRQTKRNIKWLTQSSKPGDGGFRRVAFDGEDFAYGLLSRDGQTLFSYSGGANDVTRVYQITEEAGKDPAVSTKFKLNGIPRAVSGKCNRVMMERAGQLEIHNVGKGTGKRICQIKTGSISTGALNEDGSEAAFVTGDDVLRIAKVDSVAGDTVGQPAIVLVKVPELLRCIYQLVYSDENKLHVRHYGGIVSLFDPSAKALIPIEVPQKGQEIIVSPKADYIATLQLVGKEKGDDRRFYRTTVKRKLTKDDWRNLFGYEADKIVKQL